MEGIANPALEDLPKRHIQEKRRVEVVDAMELNGDGSQKFWRLRRDS